MKKHEVVSLETYKQVKQQYESLSELIQLFEDLSAKIYRKTEVNDIFQALINEFGKTKSYSITISLMSEDNKELRTKYHSISRNTTKVLKTIANTNAAEVNIKIAGTRFWKRVIEEKCSLLVSAKDVACDTFPKNMSGNIINSLDYSQNTMVVMAPLIKNNAVIGVMVLRCFHNIELFMKSIKYFSSMITHALEYAENSVLQTQVRSSEIKYRELVENLIDGIFSIDKKGYITYVSPVIEKMLGWDAENLIGKNVAQFIYADDRQRIMNAFGYVLKGIYNPQEYRLVHKDGAIIWVRSYSKPIIENGVTIGIRGILVDVNDRKNIEQEKENLLKAIELSGTAVLIANTDFVITNVNKTMQELFQYQALELIGKPISFIANTSYRDYNNVVSNVVGEIKKHGIWEGELYLKRKDGTTFVSFSRIAAIKNEKGEFQHYFATYNDITERKKVEEERARTQKLESLGILAGGIAHDFNNISTGILGNISLAKKRVVPKSEEFEILKDAEAAAMQTKELASQLLSLTKNPMIKRESIDLNALVKQIVRFTARGTNVEIKWQPSKTPVFSKLDGNQIKQAVNNVVLNAIQSMPTGGIINVVLTNFVNTKKKSVLEYSKEYAKLSIRDHGIGIAKESISKIFDPYFTTKQTGSGLGLTIVYSIIKNHGGHIEVYSEIGAGTEVDIYLPTEKSVKHLRSTKKKVNKKLDKKQNICVLVMDDEEYIRKVSTRLLSTLGYTAVTVKDGAAAVKAYKVAMKNKHKFDLVILDLTVIGGMSGKDAVKLLLEFDPGAKVVLSSGYSNDVVVQNYKKYGFSGVMTKPYTIEDLEEVIRKVMTKWN
ncbi:MAG: PAS domain S-box protein [Elusimicrobiota bacterium]